MPQKKQKSKDNIALTGLMGSGKSSVGRTLARLLRRRFIDTDALIEDQEGMSINEIFAEKGEEYFRKVEQDIVSKVFQEKSLVISLGGGTVVDDSSRALIRENSKLIALIAKPEELYKRVKRRKARPLLNQAKNPLETLKDLWEERKKAYLDSDLQIETAKRDVESIAKEIIKSLKLKKSAISKLKVVIPAKENRYPIIFDEIQKLDLTLHSLGKKIMIVSQEPIAKHYLEELQKRFERHYQTNKIILEDGEDAKNFFSYQRILQSLLNEKFERKDSIIALGGGVVGDISGFAASTYYRGINYIQIPTTLLAMIDSSVGGKTAINVPEGKNLIGSFYQPKLVYIDVNILKTLPEREFKSGLGELVKYTVLGGKYDELMGESFFGFVERHAEDIKNKNQDILIETIEQCLKIKAAIVAQDEKEQGLRAHLNLGHTFGHGIEELTKYKRYSHGEAVAMGLACACYLGEELGYFKSSNTKKILSLMDKLELNYKIPADIDTADLIRGCAYDKKAEGGKLRWIVPKGVIGNVAIEHDLHLDSIATAIDRNRELSTAK